MSDETLRETGRSVIDVPVAWGDMDAFEHVNNTVYFRWFESGRIHYFGLAGVLGRSKPTCGPILANADCQFLVPLEYPDDIQVHTHVTAIGNSSFTMAYEVHSVSRKVVAARGRGIIVWYDYENERKAPVPDWLRKNIAAIEGDQLAT